MKWILLVLGIAACTKHNENICCVTAEQCSAIGVDDLRTCPVGLTCSDNVCVQGLCSLDVDCPSETPVCTGGLCHVCDLNHGCPATAPVCSLEPEGCAGCETGADCATFGSMALCDTNRGACVECIGDTDCPGPRPRCDAGECRRCLIDDECPSTVCDVDQGTCVASAAIRYASPGGVDINNCSQSSPCTVQKAVDSTDTLHPWVRMVPGVYNSSPITTNASCTLVGTGATSLTFGISASTGASLTVRGPSMTTAHCGVNSSISIRDASLVQGGSASSCRMTLRHVTVGGGGLYFQDNVVASIDRSKIDTLHIFTQSGIASSTVTVSNSILRSLDLSILPTSPTKLAFSFNTFYTASGVSVTCGDDASTPTGISFVNNIFYAPGTLNSVLSAGTKCIFNNNVIYPQTQSVGTNTIVSDPKLADPTNGNLHLQASSPAIDAAAPTVDEPSGDYEDKPRPVGLRRDIGAFEYQ